MKNGKMIAGTTALLLSAALASPVYSVTNEGEEDAVTLDEQNLVEVDESILRSQEMQDRIDKLIVLSEEGIEKYEQKYAQMYTKHLRLELKHITLSSRLSLEESKLIRSNGPVGARGPAAISMNLLGDSSVTAYELDSFFAGTKMAGLGEAFIKAEINTGVNAVFLASLAIHESGWGQSRIAQDKKNLFGYGAYDASPYESAIRFNSHTEGVEFVANKLKNNYLLSSGKFHSGQTLKGVNKRYSTDSGWSTKIATTMEQMDTHFMGMQDVNYKGGL